MSLVEGKQLRPSILIINEQIVGDDNRIDIHPELREIDKKTGRVNRVPLPPPAARIAGLADGDKEAATDD